MSDSWINRLVVSGRTADIDAFGASVARPGGRSPTMLSFKKLQGQLPRVEWDGLEEVEEPWDDDRGPMAVAAPDRRARQPSGTQDLMYRFSQARYEPDELLIRASRLFPKLCFVLGWVAPSNDERSSRFIHNGHTLVFRLPDQRTEKLRALAYRRYGLTDEATDDADSLWADFEGDWALLDAVVKHCSGKVTRTLAAV
jgi:hypothetical protein